MQWQRFVLDEESYVAVLGMFCCFNNYWMRNHLRKVTCQDSSNKLHPHYVIHCLWIILRCFHLRFSKQPITSSCCCFYDLCNGCWTHHLCSCHKGWSHNLIRISLHYLCNNADVCYLCNLCAYILASYYVLRIGSHLIWNLPHHWYQIGNGRETRIRT